MTMAVALIAMRWDGVLSVEKNLLMLLVLHGVSRKPDDLLLEEREPLRQHGVLLVELREHGGVVEQHDDDEQRRYGEQDRRRVRGDAEPAGHRVEPAAPGGENEEHDPGGEPHQGVALLQASAADQLEHDQDQEHGGDGGRD